MASVNMSLGGGSFTAACDSDTRMSPIDSLKSAGILTAIASGNNGFTSSISAPACISSAIAVGSSTKADVISSFSNMSNLVTVVAPGGFGGGTCAFGANNVDILGPVAVNGDSTTSYACLAGTSMAARHVAGAIAAIKSARPSATAAQIQNALVSTGLSITDTRAGGTVTKPRIRVDLASAALASAPDAPTAVSVTAGNSLIIVNFGPPASNGGAPITGYTAVCTSSNGGVPGSNTGGPGATSIQVTGLTNGKSYTCTVTATNSAGLTGSASAPSNTVTPELAGITPILMLLLD